jgi:two-component system invasion response regulator UvrY
MGYLTKRSAAEELIKAIKSIHQGKRYLEPNIAQQMAITQLSGETNPVEILSDREFEVFMALAKGKSTNDIAETLCLSPRTVGTHLYNIKQKLNANNSAEIALIAIRCGLIDP